MNSLKHLIAFIIILAFMPIKSNAQLYHVGYVYDANGNRISRQIISLQKTKNIDTEPYKNIFENDAIIETISLDNGFVKLIAYPNPVIDKINLKQESDINFNASYSISSISGTALLQGDFKELATVSMETLAAGFYIIRIQLLEVNKIIQLKIVKQ